MERRDDHLPPAFPEWLKRRLPALRAEETNPLFLALRERRRAGTAWTIAEEAALGARASGCSGREVAEAFFLEEFERHWRLALLLPLLIVLLGSLPFEWLDGPDTPQKWGAYAATFLPAISIAAWRVEHLYRRTGLRSLRRRLDSWASPPSAGPDAFARMNELDGEPMSLVHRTFIVFAFWMTWQGTIVAIFVFGSRLGLGTFVERAQGDLTWLTGCFYVAWCVDEFRRMGRNLFPHAVESELDQAGAAFDGLMASLNGDVAGGAGSEGDPRGNAEGAYAEAPPR